MIFKQLTDTGAIHSPAISPDGKFFAYVLIEKGRESVWLKNIAAGNLLQLTPSSNGENSLDSFERLHYSRDGNFLYFEKNAKGKALELYRIPAFGGAPKRIAENLWSGIVVSPDDKQVAFVRVFPKEDTTQIVLANADGSGEQVLVERKVPQFYSGWGNVLAWSPDGQSPSQAEPKGARRRITMRFSLSAWRNARKR